MQFLIQCASNMIIVLGMSYYLPGIIYEGLWWHALLAGIVVGAFNYLLKPLISSIWQDHLYITLGIFMPTANIAVFLLFALLVPGFSLTWFWPGFWGVTIITLTNYSIHSIMGYGK